MKRIKDRNSDREYSFQTKSIIIKRKIRIANPTNPGFDSLKIIHVCSIFSFLLCHVVLGFLMTRFIQSPVNDEYSILKQLGAVYINCEDEGEDRDEEDRSRFSAGK